MNPKAEIAKQLNFIVSSCRLYDEGRREEAIRVAVALRVLFHETQQSQSLIRGHLGKDGIKLRSTTMVGMMPKPHLLGFLGLEVPSGEFRPVLDETNRSEFIPVVDWWESEPILMLSNGTGESITRKQVALAAANKDGGAHVDSKKPAEYERLEAGLGIATMIRAGGQSMGIIYRNANLAILRQLGHEVLTSRDLTALTGH